MGMAMKLSAKDLGLASHAIGFYLQSLHARVTNNRGRRPGDRLQNVTLRERYRSYYEARERIRKGCDSSEPEIDVPTPDSF
jgi:hypothetical protein